jgi:serine/threonine protein kinase
MSELDGLSFKPRFSDRSTLVVPPRFQAALESKPSGRQDSPEYDLVALIQYVSKEPGMILTGTTIPGHWNVYGRGRTFVVRRFPTGGVNDLFDNDHWRPSQALKTLRTSFQDTAGEAALRYRSLIHELRILRHPPLASHPNFLRIFEISWEPDPLDSQRALPAIYTEFATLGTLQSALSTFEFSYHFKLRLILDVVEGLSALHQCSVTHGDVKLDNVMVFPIESPGSPSIGMIAKLSDFGFSLDTSSNEAFGQLIGWTPIWSAPEVGEAIMASKLYLTDIYSTGFIIWSIITNGRSLFDDLQNLPDEPELRLEAFQNLKRTNDMLDSSIAQLLVTEDDEDIDLTEVCNFLSSTLQMDPEMRSLEIILRALRGRYPRPNDDETISKLEFQPLKPFDIDQVLLFLRHDYSHLVNLPR